MDNETPSEEGYEFKKIVSSDTQVKAWHIKINKVNYQIVSGPLPRLYREVSGYEATRTGKILDFTKHLFRFKGNSLEEGCQELIKKLNGEIVRNEIPPYNQL